MKRVFWMTVVLVSLFVGVAAADPFVGVWKMQPNDKSGFKAQLVTVTATDIGHKWSYDITLSNGSPLQIVLLTNVKTGEVTLQSKDGKTVGTGHFKKTGDAAWDVETPGHKSSGSISADGKKMTIQQTLPVATTIIYDKQ
jgi:hypothetical protein